MSSAEALSLLVTLSLLVVGCAASPGRRPPTPFAGVNGPLVIAHRGGSLEAPENTVAAFRHGVSAGADWLECDVTLSADGHVVVIHDDTLERTTSGHGRVEEASLAALKALSAGGPRWSEDAVAVLRGFGVTPPAFEGRYAGERIPTLAEVLAVPEARVMIELKKTARREELVDAVLAEVRRAGAVERVALGSFEPDLLDLVAEREPAMPLIGIVEEEHELARLLERDLSVLAVRFDLIESALALVSPTVAVWAWTAYSAEMAEAAVMRGAHGVITDAPRAVVSAWRPPLPGR